MKAFIVFAAVIAVAAAGVVRNSGWGAPPPPPSIDLELAAAAAAVGSGSANANQQLLELVSGNAQGPATLSSSSGVLASVNQNEDIIQEASANIPSGTTLTINAVDVGNSAIAVDSVNANLDGANAASVQNAADTATSGEGAIAAQEVSVNNVQSRS